MYSIFPRLLDRYNEWNTIIYSNTSITSELYIYYWEIGKMPCTKSTSKPSVILTRIMVVSSTGLI